MQVKKGKGGAPSKPLLNKLVEKSETSGGKYYVCVACGHRQAGNASMDRALKHISRGCPKFKTFDYELDCEAMKQAGDSSLGATLEAEGVDPVSGESDIVHKLRAGKQARLDVEQLKKLGAQKEEKKEEIRSK